MIQDIKSKCGIFNCLIILNLIFITSVSSQEKKDFELVFVSNFNQNPIEKNKWYISKNNDSIQLSTIKFYLTNFRIKNKNSSILLENQYHLVDVLNDKNLNLYIPNIHFNNGAYLVFDLGVDEKLNTSGANSGDLDPINGMFWSWQSGYINFKIEGISPSCNTRKNKFQFHIGGYQIPYETLRTISFKLDSNKNKLVVNLEFSNFFNKINLKTENHIMTPGKDAYTLMNQLVNIFNENL